jgi:exopolysaccharide biosynthesis polyprenyl glycosylphosphotransferase
MSKINFILIRLLHGQWKQKFMLLAMDVLSISLSFLIAYLISNSVYEYRQNLSGYLRLLPMLMGFLVLSLHIMGGYRPIEERRAETELGIVCKSVFLAFLFIFAAFFALKLREFLRIFFLVWTVGSLCSILLLRFSLREFCKGLWQKGHLKQKILLVGQPDGIEEIKQLLETQRHNRFEYIEYVVPDFPYQSAAPHVIDTLPAPVTADSISRKTGNNVLIPSIQLLVETHDINQVFIVPKGILYEDGLAISNYCRSINIKVSIASNEFSADQQISIDEFTGLLVLQPPVTVPVSQAGNKVIKRFIDILGAILGLPFVMMTYTVVGIATKLEDGGPVIHRRKVVGKNGKVFDAFKLRSMRLDADEILESNPALKREYEKNFKLENDPRLTKLGHFIRKYSIDELPQLINVLFGQMSLVGPRMKVPEEVKKYYAGLEEKLFSVKPGMTGFWQVNGRQETNYDERVRMDMFYLDRWSIWMDIAILIKTVWKVLKREGAL